MMMIDWLIILFLTALVAVAFFVRSSLLRIAVVALLLFALLVREFSIGAFARSHVSHQAELGLWTKEYASGAGAIVDYCKLTGIHVIAICFLLFVLCVRGFRSVKPNTKDQVRKDSASEGQ